MQRTPSQPRSARLGYYPSTAATTVRSITTDTPAVLGRPRPLTDAERLRAQLIEEATAATRTKNGFRLFEDFVRLADALAPAKQSYQTRVRRSGEKNGRFKTGKGRDGRNARRNVERKFKGTLRRLKALQVDAEDCGYDLTRPDTLPRSMRAEAVQLRQLLETGLAHPGLATWRSPRPVEGIARGLALFVPHRALAFCRLLTRIAANLVRKLTLLVSLSVKSSAITERESLTALSTEEPDAKRVEKDSTPLEPPPDPAAPPPVEANAARGHPSAPPGESLEERKARLIAPLLADMRRRGEAIPEHLLHRLRGVHVAA